MTTTLRLCATLSSAALIAIITGFASAFGYILIAEAMGASNMEGALAMGAFLGVAPVGALVGAVIGAVLIWRMSARWPKGALVALSLLATGIVAAAVASFIILE